MRTLHPHVKQIRSKPGEEMADNKSKYTRTTPEEALVYHLEPQPGKFEVVATKPMTTQRDLSLAYSPGVAVPVQAIADNRETAYD